MSDAHSAGWRTVVELTEPLTEKACEVTRIEIKGLMMRKTKVVRVGKAELHEREYAPIWGWNGEWKKSGGVM